MALSAETLIKLSEIFGDQANVVTVSNEYVQMENWRLLPRALMVGIGENGSGDEGLLDNADLYLPQMPGEYDADYGFRRDHLTYMPPLFPDAVSDLVSAIFSGPIHLEDKVPTEIREVDGVWDNIDQTGKSGDVFLAESMSNAIAEGLDYILVDYPQVDQDQAQRDTKILDPRVYWSRVPGRCVIEVTSETIGSKVRITRAKIADFDWESIGPYGRRPFTRVKVFTRGNPYLERGDVGRYASVEIFEAEAGKEFQSTGVFTIKPPPGLSDLLDAEFAEVPLYPIYGKYIAPHFGRSFLHHTADLCRKLLVSLSDRANIEHWANAITLVVNGMSREAFDQYNKSTSKGVPRLGAGGRLHVNGGPGNQNPLFFLEHRGQAIESLRKSVEELKDDIKSSVADAAMKQASVIELATVRFFNEGRKASRLRIVQMLMRESAQAALRRTGLYYGADLQADAITFPNINTQHLIDLKEKREYVVRGKEAKILSARGANEQSVLLGLVDTTLSPSAFADAELKRLEEEVTLLAELPPKMNPGSSEPVVDSSRPPKAIKQGKDGLIA